MANNGRRLTMNDVRAASPARLLIAAFVGCPIGGIIGFIFAIVWLKLLPAGDLILIVCPLIGAIGGLFIGPLTVIKNMQATENSPEKGAE